jgi:hypothetical protein
LFIRKRVKSQPIPCVLSGKFSANKLIGGKPMDYNAGEEELRDAEQCSTPAYGTKCAAHIYGNYENYEHIARRKCAAAGYEAS